MKSSSHKEYIVIACIVAVLVGIFVLISLSVFRRPSTPSVAQTGALGNIQAPTPNEMKGGILFDSPNLHIEQKEGIMARYVNETYKYSFELFDSFSASETDTESTSSKAVVVDNRKGNGFLVLMSPLGEDVPVLTKERILQDVPGMYIANEQPISVAGVTGLCFDSTDKLWDGNARECWFVLQGILYQFSTKNQEAPLLTYTLATFREEPGLKK